MMQQLEAPPFASLPRETPPLRRIVIPLHRVLTFARQESELRPSRRLGFAMRPLLSLALATTGLCQAVPAPRSPWTERRPSTGGGADTEVLFAALSSLVEVVKTLTPRAGRVYAQLGHQPVPDAEGLDPDDRERGRTRPGDGNAAAARSEVVIELVSTASSTSASSPRADLGGLAFELAVVAAIVESKGGELCFGSAGADARSFVVRLPVCRC